MIGAIKNELIKLIAQKKVISIVIITIILLGIGLIVQVTDKDSSQSAWQEELSEELVVLEDDTISNKTDVHTDRIKEIKFRLKHNISPNGDSTGPGTVVSEFSNSPFITILIPLFVILLFGNMIIGEINDGSLKISLVSPVGRSKILLSKIGIVEIEDFEIVMEGLSDERQQMWAVKKLISGLSPFWRLERRMDSIFF